MRSRIAQQIGIDRFERAQERADGRVQSALSFSSDRAASVNILDFYRLPMLENTSELQDEDGNNLFMLDYSAFDGPDVLG
jgi:hypothetical protein